MSFLGDPCACGWAMDELSEIRRKCERCGRVAEKKSWGWMTHNPTKTVSRLSNAKEKREYAHSLRKTGDSSG